MRLLFRSQPKIHEVPVPENQRRCFTQDEIRSSGILEVMAEVAEELRKEYVDGPLPVHTHKPFLEKELYEKAISRILDRARSLNDVNGGSDMNHSQVIDSLKPYATCIRTERNSIETMYYVCLQEFVVGLYLHNRKVLLLSERNRDFYSYEDASYVKPIILLDAARDMLHEIVQKLLLETKSLLHAQEIYLNYAGSVADIMAGQYQGKTRISHKGNRTSIHFYLSDTDKAVISFFQEKMPWKLPDPPTDPESLRKTCQEEGSPFFIASLSKCDRRVLKSYEDE